MSGDSHEKNAQGRPGDRRRHGVTALVLAGVVAGMTGLSFAAVPLYRIFCQVTGYGGTTQQAERDSGKVLDRTVKVRFDANVAQDMPWRFEPVRNEVEVRIGESTLAFYEAENKTSEPIRGTATYNVTPEAAGYYFNKIDCFCFTEQVLKPGQRMDMPVNFFVDPEIVNDPDTRNITEITLSYTFFPSGDDENDAADVAAKSGDGEKNRGGS
jgi:cytochrome c oxidase assembly protein subunit 11